MTISTILPRAQAIRKLLWSHNSTLKEYTKENDNKKITARGERNHAAIIIILLLV